MRGRWQRDVKTEDDRVMPPMRSERRQVLRVLERSLEETLMWALYNEPDGYHDERMWYAMLELNVQMTFPERDFDRVLDSYEVDVEWFIRLGFEWESIGHFQKEWR
jgi:hypothetical protein